MVIQMTTKRIGKSLFVGLSLLFPLLVRAQPVASATVHTPTTGCSLAVYDVSQEIEVRGTVARIEMGGTRGRIRTQVLIESAQGVVNVQLGDGATADPRYFGISTGQPVQVTGMMKKVGPSAVLLARILTTRDRIFLLRNECGIPVRSTPRSNSAKPKDDGVISPKFRPPGSSRIANLDTA
jgi:hypothetical protein